MIGVTKSSTRSSLRELSAWVLVLVAVSLFASVAYTATTRITITPREVDAREFASIVSLVQVGRTAEAWDRFKAASTGDGALARLGGAVNAALTAGQQPQQPQQPALPPPTGSIDIAIPFGDYKRRELPDFSSQVVHVAFSLPAGAAPYTVSGNVAVYEFRGPPKTRIVSLTREPGDPGAADQSRALFSTGGKTSHIEINAGPAESVSYGGTVTLLPGVTYYFNVRNFKSLDQNQPAAVEIIWPHN